MRTLLRFVIVGTLIVSCSDRPWAGEPVGPEPAPPCLPPDTVFDIYRDSLELAVGAVLPADLTWYDQNCQEFHSYAPAMAEWTSRDSSVASIFLRDPSTVAIEAVTPGRTVVVASAGAGSDSVTVMVPDTVTMGRVVSIAAGGSASCAVDETGALYCWGDGTIAATESGLCYFAPCPMPVERTAGAERAWIGGSHACVLDVGGAARCWGNGYSGQLGAQVGGQQVVEPVSVDGGIAFSELALGGLHTCGLDGDANAYCWGTGDKGELGGGARVSDTSQPTAVAGGHHFVSISAEESMSCGVTDAGALLCWGLLGDDGLSIPGASRCGTTFQDKSGPVTSYVTCALTPVRVPLLPQGADTTFSSVSGRCALTTMGSVYCYRVARMERIVPPGSFVSIATGPSHGCGLTASGDARCWGQGSDGQRGDGTMSFSSVPVTVVGRHAFVQLAVGRTHTCGLVTQGEVWCWGSNGSGEAGVSMRSDTRAPGRVRGQS